MTFTFQSSYVFYPRKCNPGPVVVKLLIDPFLSIQNMHLLFQSVYKNIDAQDKKGVSRIRGNELVDTVTDGHRPYDRHSNNVDSEKMLLWLKFQIGHHQISKICRRFILRRSPAIIF